MAEIPTIVKRRLQAQVIKPLFEEMAARFGEKEARAVLDSAVRKAAIAEGKEFAAKLSVPALNRAWSLLLKSLGEVRIAPNALAASAAAQSFPTRPIRMIVSFPPGAGVDRVDSDTA